MTFRFCTETAFFCLLFLLCVATQTVQAQACGTCNWYGNNYAACCNQSTGWGWENNLSCVGPQECTNAGQVLNQGGGYCNGYAYCSSSSQDPDGDGWGWTGTASCIVSDSGADSCGGGGGSSGGGSCNGYAYCSSSGQDPDGDGWGWTGTDSCIFPAG